MTKNYYLRSESFTLQGTLYGGKQSEQIDVLIIWNFWGILSYDTLKNKSNSSSISQSRVYENPPVEVIDKNVTVQVLNKNTYEVLATYDFWIH